MYEICCIHEDWPRNPSSWEDYCAYRARAAIRFGHEGLDLVLRHLRLAEDSDEKLMKISMAARSKMVTRPSTGARACLRLLHELGGDEGASLVAANREFEMVGRPPTLPVPLCHHR